MTHPSDVPWPWDLKDVFDRNQIKFEKSMNERALLCFFLAKMQKIDPDVVVGHDILGFDLPVLLDRLRKENIPHWSRLGRLKRTNKLRATVSMTAFCHKTIEKYFRNSFVYLIPCFIYNVKCPLGVDYFVC